MTIQEVNNPATTRLFLNLPKKLYSKDPNWTCPLDSEIEGIFNPDRNTCYQHGEAIRWVLFDHQQQLIGRIAAFTDERKAHDFDCPTGGIGFFECTDNQHAANLLFDTAQKWLQERKMKAMNGPVNFGENYLHWGLLVNGFGPQGYGMPYHHTYYKRLFENYGFRNFFEQYSFHRSLIDPYPPRMVTFAEYIASRSNYSFRHFSFSQADKYISDLVKVYNDVWSSFHQHYTPLKHGDIKKMLNESKMLIDEEQIWFAYDHDKPVGLIVALPDINQLLRRLKNGKLNLLNLLKMLYFKKRKTITRSRALIAGVHPDYHNKGVVAALFLQYNKALQRKPWYKEVELSWVGDYNPKMLRIYEQIGAVKHKTHVTYRYLFDRSATFNRFTN
jgi:hypothetical protein